MTDKVENLMSFNDKKLPDEMYKKWKSDNTVTAEVQWENISFKHHILRQMIYIRSESNAWGISTIVDTLGVINAPPVE